MYSGLAFKFSVVITSPLMHPRHWSATNFVINVELFSDHKNLMFGCIHIAPISYSITS